MLITELIEYYIKNDTLMKAVFAKLKPQIVSCAVGSIILFLPIFIFKRIDNSLLSFCVAAPFYIPFIISLFCINEGVKKQLKLPKKPFFWNSSKNNKVFYDYESAIILQFLKKNNCFELSKIDLIIEQLTEKSVNKPLNLIFPISLGVILLPIWDNWIAYLFTAQSDFTMLAKYLFISIYLLIGILFFRFGLKDSLIFYYDLAFNKKQRTMKHILSVLKEMRFQIVMENITIPPDIVK